MAKFLISVIIPTRNRQKYAASAVKQIFALNQNIQVILQDNSDDETLRDIIKPYLNDERLTYRHITERIAAIDNYDTAAALAEGEYFIAIGDDDALLPNISKLAAWMKKNRIDAVKPAKGLEYTWPDSKNPNKDYRPGFIWIEKLSGKVKLQNPYDGVVNMLKDGEVNYIKYPIAESYHGLVKTECMKEVHRRTGRYYGGISPDMYSAICLSLLPNIKFAEINFPISLPGACPKSTTVANEKGMHAGELSKAPHFIGLKEPYKWDKRIPEFYSVDTIWGETLFKAIDAMNLDDMIDKYFNREVYINTIYRNNFAMKNVYLDTLSQHDMKLIIDSNKKKKTFIRKAFQGIRTVVRCVTGQKLRVVGCKDIIDAVGYANNFINKGDNKKKWNSIMNTVV